jgi:hypothetical protein
MKKLAALVVLILLTACNPQEMQVCEDILEGEAQVIEKVAEDMLKPPFKQKEPQ